MSPVQVDIEMKLEDFQAPAIDSHPIMKAIDVMANKEEAEFLENIKKGDFSSLISYKNNRSTSLKGEFGRIEIVIVTNQFTQPGYNPKNDRVFLYWWETLDEEEGEFSDT